MVRGPVIELASFPRHLRGGALARVRLGGPAGVSESADKAKTLSALEYAADQGHLAAQWKVGRMYAAGDGAPKDDQRAFIYFSQSPTRTRMSLRVLRRRASWPMPSWRWATTI